MKLAVIGDPVAHSASPNLHRAFLAAAGIDGTYEAICVVAGTAARAIDDLRRRGYTGLNVTTPLKEEAYACADDRDAAALAAGSANTLVLGPRVTAYNTDGAGAIGALADAGLLDLTAKHVLVLGAGPTARSCLIALAAAGAIPSIWNRTTSHMRSVAERCGAIPWSAADAPPHAILSALPPNADLTDPALLTALTETPIVIDANYGPRSTLAATLHRPIIEGTKMLEASAAASFTLFKTHTPTK